MTHIIPEESSDELLDLRITKSTDGQTLYLHYNGGTKAFPRSVVVRMLTAFSMVLHSTDRAITATAARLEAERAARTPTPQPEQTKLKTLNLSDIGL